MKKIILTYLFIGFVNHFILGQTNSPNYKKADSIALNFPKSKYYFYTETALELTENLTGEKEKCRAVFRWITNNIKYSFKNFMDDPMSVFRKKMGVCAGYAALFKAMCEDVKITCLVISGEAGNEHDKHAWNIVKLDGEWLIMDPTWAAGKVTNIFATEFKKDYDDSYWMAEYNYFVKTHWCKESNWERYILKKGEE